MTKQDILAAYIFDFGGVLMKHDLEGCLEAFQQMMAEEDITDRLGLGNEQPGTLRARFELGELSAEEFIGHVLNNCRPGTTAQQVIDAWNMIHAGIDESTWEEIRRLKDKGYRLYLFSNTDAIHWQHALALYKDKIDASFDRVFLSFEMGLCKPDAGAYEFINNEIGGSPSRICFIDDNAVNRLAAEQLVGWKTCAAIDELDKIVNI